MIDLARFLFENILCLLVILIEITFLIAIIYVFIFVFVNILMMIFHILRLKKLFRATENVKLNLIVGLMIIFCYSSKDINDYKQSFRTNLDD